MESADERAHKSIFHREESGGNGCKVSEKRFFDGSGPRENEGKTPRWGVFSKFSPQSKEYRRRGCAEAPRRRDLTKSSRCDWGEQALCSSEFVLCANSVTPTKKRRTCQRCVFLFFDCSSSICVGVLLLVPGQREGPGRVPAALPVAGQVHASSREFARVRASSQSELGNSETRKLDSSKKQAFACFFASPQ